MSSPARCPQCAWACTDVAQNLEAVAEQVEQLSAHLATQHDLTWHRAHEVAMDWGLQQVRGQRPPE